MPRIECNAGIVPKKTSPPTSQNTHQSHLAEQAKNVGIGIDRTADAQQQHPPSVELTLEYGKTLILCVRPVVCDHPHVSASTVNPTATGKTADHAKKQATYTKSAATPSSDRNSHSHVIVEITLQPTPSNDCLSQIRAIVDKDINTQKNVDFGPNNERKEAYCALLYKQFVWVNGTTVKKKNEHISQKNSINTHAKKQQRYCDSIYYCLTSSNIFYKDPEQDNEFVKIVEEFATFAKVNDENKKKIDLYARELSSLCNQLKNHFYAKKNDESADKLFARNAVDLLDNYLDMFDPFEMQCKLVSELKKNGFDMMDSFRKSSIEESYSKIVFEP